MENTSSQSGLVTFPSTIEYVQHLSGNPRSEFRLAKQIRTAFAIITISVGLVGNAITFRVMTSKAMRKTSVGVFFAAIAVTNTLTLLLGQLPVLLDFFHGLDLPSLHYWSCRWVFFLLFSVGDMAVWLMLAVTVDRFISMVFPWKRKQLCRPGRALLTCVGLAAAAVAKNAHVFWTRGRQEVVDDDGTVDIVECGWPREDYEYFGKYVRPWLAFTLYAFIPLTGLLVLNTVIAVVFWHHSKHRRAAQQQQQEEIRHKPPTSAAAAATPAAAAAPRSDAISDQAGGTWRVSRQVRQLTLMLLTVSIAFIIMISPSIIVLIIKPHVATTPEELASYALIEAVADSLSYVNHAANFFLYCLSGANFRREVRRMFSCRRNQVGPQGTSFSPQSRPS